VPPIDLEQVRRELLTVLETYHRSWATAVHDLSEGGILVAVTEMALGPEDRPRRGAHLDLSEAAGEVGDFAACFGEAGGFLMEIEAQAASGFEELATRNGCVWTRLGEVTDEPTLRVDGVEGASLSWNLSELAAAHAATMMELLSREGVH
jgi:phosphoribosylformylglycinamidine synthase